MSRYGQYGQHDSQPVTEADNGFLGLNMKIERGLLKPGLCSGLVNKRLMRGAAETRPGICTPVWANFVEFGTIYGSAVYSDPEDTEWLLLATGAGVWRLRYDRFPDLIPYPTGQTVSSPVDMVQAFSKVLLFRGPGKNTLEWNGELGSAWTAIVPTAGGTGVDTIPNAWTAELFGNRLLVPTGRDEVAVSDVLDYTHYDSIMAQFKINSGTDELLVRLFPRDQTSVLAFKDNSIFVLSNLYGDWSVNARLDQVNREIGCAARLSVATVGGDVFFLSTTGVYAVQSVIQQRLQTAAVAVSDPIEPLINRINWVAADKACAAVWGPYYLLAVPLDGSTVNNAVLRYNSVGGQWEGYDEADWGFAVSRFHVTDYQGGKRLYAVDAVHGRVYLLDEGKADVVAGVTHQIEDLIETRGYSMDLPAESKAFVRARVSVATWNPCFSVEVVSDGIGEAVMLADSVTKDRGEYYNFGKPDYDTSNVNGDAEAPGRKDYSVVPDGVYLGTGLRLDLKQEAVEPFTMRAHGRWVSVRIRNTQGQCDVRAVQVDGAELKGDRTEA